MKRMFKTSLFGYKKHQVEQCIADVKKDYEDELWKKQERMLELNEENRNMRYKIQELEEIIHNYQQEENYISKALVKAEQKAQIIIDASQLEVEQQMKKLKQEKLRWEERAKEVRRQLMDFEKTVYKVMEDFHSEINYLASKDISEEIIEGKINRDEHIGNETENIRSVS